MTRIFLASAALALSACSSMGGGVAGPSSGCTDEPMSGGKLRIACTASTDTTAKVMADRTMARAAQLTLDKGNEWFEISSKVDGKNMQSMVITMGKGETLAGGPKQYNAKETLASLKSKIS